MGNLVKKKEKGRNKCGDEKKSAMSAFDVGDSN
jgi:hypothetical protein